MIRRPGEYIRPGHRLVLRQIASGLLDQSSIPVIKAQQQLLDEFANDQWWVDVTIPMLELMRRRLRGLVKLLAKTKRVIVYTDITDELGDMKEIDLHRVAVGVDADRFRANARQYLQSHLDHAALQKVRRNRQLTPVDLSALEQMLVDAGVGDSQDVARASEEAHGFGLFVRSLVGLERDAAAEAFSRFLDDRTYSDLHARPDRLRLGCRHPPDRTRSPGCRAALRAAVHRPCLPTGQKTCSAAPTSTPSFMR